MALADWKHLGLRVWRRLFRRESRVCRIEIVHQVQIAWNPDHLIYIRAYYRYCVDIFRQGLQDWPEPANFVFGDYPVRFANDWPTFRIDLQCEHVLVRPGGRDSANAPAGRTALLDGTGYYLVRLERLGHLQTLDVVIDYSRSNIVHVQQSGLFAEYARRTIYLAPCLHEPQFGSPRREQSVLTLFADPGQSRRKLFMTELRAAGLAVRNVRGVYDLGELQKIYQRTQILVNLHQTCDHHTFEELRVLPALLCGVIVISEEVPLRECVPYHEFIIWSSRAQMIATIRAVRADYAAHWQRIFADPRLRQILLGLRSDALAQARVALQRLRCR